MRPLREFLATESAGAVLLAGAAVVALLWANAWPGSYADVLHLPVSLNAGLRMHFTAQHVVNDALMSVFFLVVGMEIKRELVDGELSSPRQAALPALAALGGMVVPAGLYLALTAGTGDTHAWGIPMATDIALALGVVVALGSRVPTGAKVFLLALAVVDDIGAIVVIAVAYSAGVRWWYLLGALACVAAVAFVARVRPESTVIVVLLGLLMWRLTYAAGIHATIAGVAMGLLTPTHRIPALEHRLHPWSSLVIVPIFAFMNAGVAVDGTALRAALDSRVALGVAVGLLVGKPLGILLAVRLGTRLGLQLPTGVDMPMIAALGVVAGIGFTVSILVADLALDHVETVAAAKIAIIAASTGAAAIGALALRLRSGQLHDEVALGADGG
ncbi:MAG: Na+/H+ antiporter NhaA [Acidimicrobiales bacterium]